MRPTPPRPRAGRGDLGYRAVVDRAALGLPFEALVQVTMSQEDAATTAAFEAGLLEVPEIWNAERLFGDPDYLLGLSRPTSTTMPACTTRRSPNSRAWGAAPRPSSCARSSTTGPYRHKETRDHPDCVADHRTSVYLSRAPDTGDGQ